MNPSGRDYLPCKVMTGNRFFLLSPRCSTHSVWFKFSDSYCSYALPVYVPFTFLTFTSRYHTISNLNVRLMVVVSTDTKLKGDKKYIFGDSVHTQKECV